MHRATPANSSFRAYSAGGARALLEKVADATGIVDDLSGMQTIAASFMKGEGRKGIEHAQQYGFTSLPFDPDEAKDGKPGLGPETFISFIGGNRSFPSAGPVDDRRHRMKGLEKGDVALFGGRDTGQQFHMNGIGTFMSAFAGAGKKLRFQLQKKPDSGGQGGAATFAEGNGAGGQADGKTEMGQKPVYKNESAAHFELTDDGTVSVNKAHEMSLPDGTAVIVRGGQVYLGGDPSKGHTFSPVVTVAGPSPFVQARIT
jgi:hypothetical protein